MDFDITWLLTLISLIGMIFSVRQKVLCFYIWLVADTLWFILDYTCGVYGRAVLDFVQIALAFWGIVEWKKESNFKY